ncbi:hypothetical protein EBF03_03525 [Arcanobacterium haemolyticum]|nr:hypothetical protein EBF03_03525 [Arcanobacterium haemolyticum]
MTGFPSPELEAVFDQVAKADAIVAVTPAYNASYSGLFKMFFDVLPKAAADSDGAGGRARTRGCSGQR